MANRYFEFNEQIPIEEARELHAQFRHHLDHVVKASYMPGTNGNHVIVADGDGESITQIFGGEDEKFIDLYYIDEYSKI
ncbi:hypothetical protein AC790_13480 [Pantoea sp. RIT-PI-b]|uniref:hypothetical protein n=1 Tax=Pantoea sp. RIT-PI-b TaxID=1681195 RepID=UPI0006768681|nr:hypothetical protein [Pantoea sp. RIT-PI-b]KNC11574.1 hypothetical protein AC790_13480 [Pantoea sp. RIT-PI-b]